MAKELTDEQIDYIATLAARDFTSNAREAILACCREALISRGVAPDKLKTEHILMALVIARAVKVTGARSFQKDDLVAMFDKAIKLLAQ